MLSDHALLLIAVSVATLNGIASIARTIWHWEKRRDWKRKQEVDLWDNSAAIVAAGGYREARGSGGYVIRSAEGRRSNRGGTLTDEEIAAGVLQFHATPFYTIDGVPQSQNTRFDRGVDRDGEREF